MASWICRLMVEREIIKPDEQEIYEFGIRNGFIILLNVLTAFLIGLFTGELLVVFVFTVSFMMIRSYTGGYHSNSRVFCYIGSNAILFLPIYTQGLFVSMGMTAVYLFLVVAVVIIIFLSPLHSKNRKLDEHERKHFGKRARIVTLIEALVFLLLYSMEQTKSAYAVYSSIVLTAVLMLLGKLQLFIQLHTE